VIDIIKIPSEYFKKSILYAINLGEDTDTVAALTGGMLGAMFTGENDLPQDWLSKIVKLDDIENLIKLFYETFQEEIED
jgi:ADP-ribosylglycohydrolase